MALFRAYCRQELSEKNFFSKDHDRGVLCQGAVNILLLECTPYSASRSYVYIQSSFISVRPKGIILSGHIEKRGSALSDNERYLLQP
jgi:hypothetical protein